MNETGGSPKGTYSSRGLGHGYLHLIVGKRYRVVKEFRDFDGQVHPVGEEWAFIGTAFLPYDDGRSLFVSLDGDKEWHIRMQDREEEQRYILDNLSEYIVAAT
jgi:Domain of unknown function (DUF3601)